MSDDKKEVGDTSEAGSRSSFRVFDDEYVVVSVPHLRSPALDTLTEAEAEVAKAILDGLCDTEIATRRGTSLSTVRNQISSVFDKLDVNSRFELVACLTDEPDH